MYEQLSLMTFPTQTSGASASRAKTSASPASKKACKKVSEADCFTRLCDCLPAVGKKIDPDGYSLKMLKIYLALETDLTSHGCCLKWGGYGYSCEWQVLNSKDFGVPQNRERVFIVGHLGNGSGRKVFPIRPAGGENPCKLNEITQGVADAQRIYDGGGLARTLKGESGGQGGKTGLYAVKCIGNTNPCGHGQGGNVYSSQGLAPALTVAKSTPLQVCMSIKGQRLQKQIDVAPTIDTDCRNNLTRKQTCCSVLTPDREKKRQNGRRIKEPGEPSFTLTAQDRHGVAIFDDQGRKNKQLKPMDICPTLRAQSHGNEPKVIGGVGLPIREATKQGYSFAYPGDGVNIGVPNSATRRGRVNHGLANTLTTASEMGVVDYAIRIRRLTPRECWRLQGFPDEYFDKAKAAGISDTQLYKQAGNSVSVPVAKAIGERLKEVEEHGCKANR